MTPEPRQDFAGLKGHVAAWFLTSPLRRLLEWKMGKPEERIMALLELTGTETVLDAGCGSGFHTLLMAAALPEGKVIAVDISTEMLARLERNASRRGLRERVAVELADGLRLPLADASVDRALSAAVWHHLDDPQGACDELARVLEPGGVAVVSDLRILSDTKAVRGLDGHDEAFGEQDMRATMERAGLEDVRVELVGRWLVGAGRKA